MPPVLPAAASAAMPPILPAAASEAMPPPTHSPSAASEATPRPHALYPAVQPRTSRRAASRRQCRAGPAGTGEPSTVTRAPRSRARLLPLTKRRIPVAKPRTPHPIPQAAQLFKLQSRNGRGRGGRPLVLSLGGSKGGYSLSRKRISPFFACSATGTAPHSL